MKKLPAVSSVKISLKEGLTILELKPGNTLTIEEMRRVIKNAGYPTKEAAVVARGTPGDGKVFVVSGTNETLKLSSPPEKSGDDWKMSVAAPEK